MHAHPNARLTPIGRERLTRQPLDGGRSLAQLAADNGIIERTARKRLARFNRVGHWITADRRQGCSPGAGYEKVHVSVDDTTRLS